MPDEVASDPMMFTDTSTSVLPSSPVEASLSEKAAIKFTGYAIDGLVTTDGGDPNGAYRSELHNGIGHTASSNALVTATALFLIVGSAAFLM